MGNFKLGKVKIVGLTACVPEKIIDNLQNSSFSAEEMTDFIETTGVQQRRKAPVDVCTSDLALVATERLLGSLKWDPSEVDVLVLVSQSTDFKIPMTSPILQYRLGLSKKCVVFDVPLGCSGYVYGISIITAFMQSTGLKKGLLLAGDTTNGNSEQDKSSTPLFGDAATATAFEYDENAPEMFFNLGSDGAGYKAIYIPDGGARSPYSEESMVMKEVEPSIVRCGINLVLDGMDVFSFGITQAPKTVNTVLDHFHLDKSKVDYFIFHQANMMMNKMILKKLKLPPEKVPHSLKMFGNTSSASIPLTLVTQLKEVMDKGGEHTFVLCGFGIGLSWGAVHLTISDLACCNLVEYDK